MAKENKRLNGLLMNVLSARYADFLGHNLDFVENGLDDSRMDYIPLEGLISEIMNIRFDFKHLSLEEKRACYGEIFEEFNQSAQKEMLTLNGYTQYVQMILNAFNKKVAKKLDISPAVVNVYNFLVRGMPFRFTEDNLRNRISIYIDFDRVNYDVPEYNMAFLVTLIKCNLNLKYMECLKLSNIGNPIIVEYSDIDAFVASCLATKRCLNIAFYKNKVDKSSLNYEEACAPDDFYIEKNSIVFLRDMIAECGLHHTEIAVMLKEYANTISEMGFDAIKKHSINNLCYYEEFNEKQLEYSVKDDKNGVEYVMNQPLLAYLSVRKNGMPKLMKELGFVYDCNKLKSAKEIKTYMKNNNSYFLKGKNGFSCFWGEDVILKQVFVEFDEDFGVISDDEMLDEEEFE